MSAIALVVLAGAGAGSMSADASRSHPPAKHCASGSTPARIAGKHVCLKAGGRCAKRLDAAYHRYRYHCHSGRLVRFTISKPAPPPPPAGTPPTLPEPPAPAGELVDVGGYRIHLECVGTGSPTVVIETGKTATRLNYRKVQYALGAETRVCTYDRPGTTAPVPGASDQRPAHVPPTSETFARELHTALSNAGVPGPYVLAGTSFGGLLVSTFTARYPSDVAGLVFIDAIAPGFVESWLQILLADTEPWDGRADVGLLRGSSFGSRPAVVLATRNPGDIPDFQSRAANVVVARAPQYSHFVFLDAPGLAYEAIRVAIGAVRAGGALPTCAQTRLPKIGAQCGP